MEQNLSFSRPGQNCCSVPLLLLLLLHTTNFLFLLGTENAMGGVGPSLLCDLVWSKLDKC